MILQTALSLSLSQPRNDMLPALDVMKEYLGLLFSFPDVVDIHKGAANKVKDCEKMKEECRIDVSAVPCDWTKHILWIDRLGSSRD